MSDEILDRLVKAIEKLSSNGDQLPKPEKLTTYDDYDLWEDRMKLYLEFVSEGSRSLPILGQLDSEVYAVARAANTTSALTTATIFERPRREFGRSSTPRVDRATLREGRQHARESVVDFQRHLRVLVNDLQSMVSRVNEVAKSVGLSINAGKTKVFSSCIPDQEKAPLGIDGCQLEEVDSFKYLGARLLPNGQSKDDIVSRIYAARWVFSSLRKCLWNRRDLPIATKIRVYRASVRSVLLYGCECWALRVEDEQKLEVFDHHCLRIILRVKLTDFVSNEIVRARCDNIARITQAIQERRQRWFGHVLRRPPQELSVIALDPAPLPHWRRRRGGQFKTWLDTVRQDMEVVLGPSVFGLRRWRREWVELSRSAAADRHAWRGTIRDIIEAG
nr:unnamed protein product [Spirometra erinaceieuropaei]